MLIRRFHPKKKGKLARTGKEVEKIPGAELRETSSGAIQIRATSAKIQAGDTDLDHGQCITCHLPFRVRNGSKVYDVNPD